MRSLIFAVALFLSAVTFAQSVPPRFTMEWEALAAHIVERLDLQPGERFLAVAHPDHFDELIPHLRKQLHSLVYLDSIATWAFSPRLSNKNYSREDLLSLLVLQLHENKENPN